MNARQIPEARRLDLIARCSEKAVRTGCRMQVYEARGLTASENYNALRRQQNAALETMSALKIHTSAR